MAKLPVCSGAEAVRAFERLGYYKVKTKTPYVRLKHDSRQSLSVPQHRTLATGTLRDLIKYSGFTIEEFEENL